MNSTASASASGPSQAKDLSLEAMRGWASVVVLVWHLLIAFTPRFVFSEDGGFVGSPFYGFIHGTAAANVFFLLTGFVLTQRYFNKPDASYLAVGAMKRWFRLLPLPLLSVLFSWCLYHFDLYSFEQAGKITQSAWLFTCAGAVPSPAHDSFFTALRQGVFGVFFLREHSFNSNLWTMNFELYGSFMAFGFAFLINRFKDQPPLVFLFSLLCGVGSFFLDPCYFLFLAGTLLAAYEPFFRSLSTPLALAALALGLFCLGYRAPVGAYAFMQPLASLDQVVLYFFTSGLGGALILIACRGSRPVHTFFQNPLSRILGQLSFPLYLMHIPLICSLGSFLFIKLLPASYAVAACLTSLAVVAALLLVSFALSRFDLWWVAFINRRFNVSLHVLPRIIHKVA